MWSRGGSSGNCLSRPVDSPTARGRRLLKKGSRVAVALREGEAQMGFADVPALIEHLDDDRLTRSVMVGFNNLPTWNLRVRDVVSDLLQGLADYDLGKDWRRRQGWSAGNTPERILHGRRLKA